MILTPKSCLNCISRSGMEIADWGHILGVKLGEAKRQNIHSSSFLIKILQCAPVIFSPVFYSHLLLQLGAMPKSSCVWVRQCRWGEWPCLVNEADDIVPGLSHLIKIWNGNYWLIDIYFWSLTDDPWFSHHFTFNEGSSILQTYHLLRRAHLFTAVIVVWPKNTLWPAIEQMYACVIMLYGSYTD